MSDQDTRKHYRVLCYGWCHTDPVGERKCWIDYAPDRTAYEGDVVDDLPPAIIPGLLAQGLIEEAAQDNGKGGEG